MTNNEDLLVNITGSTTILEGFNGAAAKAQAQGELPFPTKCYKREWFSEAFGKIEPIGHRVLTVDACLIKESRFTIISKIAMRKLGYVRADSTLGKLSYICAQNGNIIISYEFNGTLWITIKRPEFLHQSIQAVQNRTKENAEFLSLAIPNLNVTPLRQRLKIKR